MKKLAILLCIATGLISCGNKKDEINLPITRTFDCDVLVIGGGPAGLSAAICSARKGVKTILAERNGCLGGMATSGMVAPLMSSTTPDGKTMIIRGFFEEFVDSMIAANGAIHPLKSEIGSLTAYRDKGHHGLTTFDYECFKKTAEDLCKQAGVELLYHLLFVKADTEDNKVTHFISFLPGRLILRESFLFLCTGLSSAYCRLLLR